MKSAYLELSEEDYGAVNDLLDQIIQKADDGILGNPRARMIDIKSLAIDAQNRMKESVINGGDAA